MVEILAQNLGYQYGYRWVFKESELSIPAEKIVGILGGNGSGKSTLLRLFSGVFTPSSGIIELKHPRLGTLERSQWYRFLSWAAPSIAPPQDLSVLEVLSLHFRLKQPVVPLEVILKEADLQLVKNQALKLLSSGQLQRLKIALAVFSQSFYIILDEPSTNLDTENFDLIWSLIQRYQNGRTILVATNDPREQSFLSISFVIKNLKIELITI